MRFLREKLRRHHNGCGGLWSALTKPQTAVTNEGRWRMPRLWFSLCIIAGLSIMLVTLGESRRSPVPNTVAAISPIPISSVIQRPRAQIPSGAIQPHHEQTLIPQKSEPITPSPAEQETAAVLERVTPDSPAQESIEAEANESADSSADSNELADEPAESAEPVTASAYLAQQPWITARVKSGDTLSRIFVRHGFPARQAVIIAGLEPAAPLLKIRPGQEIRLKADPEGSVGLLEYRLSRLETLQLSTESGDYAFEHTVRQPEIRVNNAQATIDTSVLGAAKEAGVPTQTMYQFIEMFGWQVDFSMDIQPGDQFALIYEEQYLDDKKIGNGEVIAAELVMSGKNLRAVRFFEDGATTYYAPNGDGIKGAFLRAPIAFPRITSNFSKRRLHPIKKVWRAHRGVDYGAPRGTPVMATGDGTVKIARTENGYGKTIIIRHGGKYETLYAHLSGYARGIKSGARVQQGQVIGYVGSTGLSTGPHLHYEFRIHGVHQNPVTVDLPKSDPIAAEYLPGFQQSAQRWVGELDYLRQVALAKNLTSS